MAMSTNRTGQEPHVEPHVVKNANQARQAVTGHGVRYVLTISTVAVVVIFVGIYLYYFQ